MWELIKKLQEQRDSLKAEVRKINEDAVTESRDLTTDEKTDFDSKSASIAKLDERIGELIEQEARAEAGAEARSVQVVNEPNPVYSQTPEGKREASYFRDLFNFRNNNDRAAGDRLIRSQETRVGDLSTSAGVGGEFAPPLWLVEEFIKLARPGRTTADLMHHADLPNGVSSINLPKVVTGAATGVQSTQNTNVTDTALTTGSVSTGITTVAGQQTVSLQQLKQSGIPFDEVVLGDLAADYAKQVDQIVINDLTGASGITSITDSTATITVANVYSDIANAVNSIASNRFLPPDAIIMSPARWYWICSRFDSQGRPLVTPSGPAFNQVASTGKPQAEGSVGEILGLPVYLDPLMPISGTSPAPADAMFVIRRDDNWLFESAVEAASFDATYANQLTVLFRIHGFLGFIPRYAKSIAQIGGAGYSPAPTF